MRVHKLTFAALAVAASLSLTACQGEEDGTGQAAPSSASSSGGGSGSGGADQGGADGSEGKGSDGNGAAGGSGSDVSGKAGKCRTDELEITASDQSISDEPDGTVVVELKNGGGRDCSISGYAGVDLKTSEGPLSAKRAGRETGPAVLKDGKSTFFGITYPLNESGGSGVRITGLVVTPPDETKSVTLDWPGAATLPVTDGSGTPVTIGPMGSAGQGG
ncbi:MULTISPECIES: DUF4232 domain-containing protein [unclassified Streptomyces]|uniref:DUF4232 domain-containing protein n=1 Tax=unclassified Streptomyces TaxID=2593676 RepID=UPI00093BCB54|nr:DUF4232 domain-containing protein [Streptomyces sp. TSRI0281]OKI48203.1 hypothetical protein A6A29_03975 [Streptomyces sp. TSRI0281]